MLYVTHSSNAIYSSASFSRTPWSPNSPSRTSQSPITDRSTKLSAKFLRFLWLEYFPPYLAAPYAQNLELELSITTISVFQLWLYSMPSPFSISPPSVYLRSPDRTAFNNKETAVLTPSLFYWNMFSKILSLLTSKLHVTRMLPLTEKREQSSHPRLSTFHL